MPTYSLTMAQSIALQRKDLLGNEAQGEHVFRYVK
jgi:hypothetical protein